MTSFFRLAFFLIIISQAVICCSGSDNEKKSSPTDISVPEHFLSEIISDNHIVAEVGDHAADFTLAAPTDSGKSDIGDLYNTDMLGNIRGDDGIWDRGALAY